MKTFVKYIFIIASNIYEIWITNILVLLCISCIDVQYIMHSLNRGNKECWIVNCLILHFDLQLVPVIVVDLFTDHTATYNGKYFELTKLSFKTNILNDTIAAVFGGDF